MKKLIKSIAGRMAMILCLTFGVSMLAEAQVPSIPRQQQRYRNYNRNYSRNISWGSQYDWLSTRYCTYDDIRYMDRGQIRVMKNSIYARHGRRFRDANLRRYFNSQRWYNGWRDEVPSREFNRYENYNINFLLKYE